jgi:hypothetical protein
MNRRTLIVSGLAGSTTAFAGCSSDGSDQPEQTEDSGSSGEDDTSDDSSDEAEVNPDTSVVATVRYNAQNVVFSYDYFSDQDTSDATTPTEVVFHTGETPESGSIIYRVDDPQSSRDVEFGFREDFNVGDRSDLPPTKVTATFEDGSTEVLTEESIDGSGPFIGDRIDVEKSAQTGDTVITATSFNADYLTVESGSGEVVGRIDEEGGSVTIPAEDAYNVVQGDSLRNRLSFEVVAHVGDSETNLRLVTAGYPDLDYDAARTVNDRYRTEFEMTRYDEITVFGGNMAVGTQDPNAELTQSEARITEPTSIVSEELLIVEVKTEAGHVISLFPSPAADQN